MTTAIKPTTAKFTVIAAEPDGKEYVYLRLQPDYTKEENKAWSPYTPSGLIQLTVKPSVAENFPIGQGFTVLFTPEDN